jgi:hypothetical protein
MSPSTPEFRDCDEPSRWHKYDRAFRRTTLSTWASDGAHLNNRSVAPGSASSGLDVHFELYGSLVDLTDEVSMSSATCSVTSST